MPIQRSQILGAIAVIGIMGCLLIAAPASVEEPSHPTRALRAGPAPMAEIVLRRAIEASSGMALVQARQGLARLLESRMLLSAALSELSLAAEGARREAAPWVYASLQADMGRCRLKQGDIRGADAAADAAAKGFGLEAQRPQPVPAGVDKTRGDIWLLMGNIDKAAGKYDSAAAHYRKARAGSAGDLAARIAAAECDLHQLRRDLSRAQQLCERALAGQPRGHPERAYTERILGLVYFFSGDAIGAMNAHSRAQEALRRHGAAHDARWLQEFIVDDRAAVLEQDGKSVQLLDPLITELEELTAELENSEEVLHWRVSDAKLRLADLLRRQERWEDAEDLVAQALVAHQMRPDGWDEIPDYATIFELSGLIARDQGKDEEAREYFQRALGVLEPIVGKDSPDVQYLVEEIATITAELAEDEEKAGTDAPLLEVQWTE